VRNAPAASTIPSVDSSLAPYLSERCPLRGTHHQEPQYHRDHVDSRPERRGRVADPVQREPDPLEEDGEHYLDPAAPHRRQKSGQDRGREHPAPEEVDAEHRIGHPALHEREDRKQAEPPASEATTHGSPHPIDERPYGIRA